MSDNIPQKHSVPSSGTGSDRRSHKLAHLVEHLLADEACLREELRDMGGFAKLVALPGRARECYARYTSQKRTMHRIHTLKRELISSRRIVADVKSYRSPEEFEEALKSLEPEPNFWEHAQQLFEYQDEVTRELLLADRYTSILETIEECLDARALLLLDPQSVPGGSFRPAWDELIFSVLGLVRDLMRASRKISTKGAPPRGALARLRWLGVKLGNDQERFVALSREISESRVGLKVRILDALRIISSRSKIESASILLGVLIALGAASSWAYYSVLGIQVLSYWTIEDLLLGGALLAPVGVLILVLLGKVLEWRHRGAVRRAENGRILVPWFFRRLVYAEPISIFLVALILMVGLVVVTSYGHGRLKYALHESAVSENRGVESAILSNGVYLERIKLFGATARAAVFLIWDSAGSRVVAFDREHILCHANDTLCSKFVKVKPTENDPLQVEVHIGRGAFPETQVSSGMDHFAKTLLGCWRVQSDDLPSTVYFESGQYKTACEEYVVTGESCASPFIAKSPNAPSTASVSGIWVVGFASRKGHPANNLDLGEQRAKTVAEQLRSSDWKDVRTIGIGESFLAGAAESGSDSQFAESDSPEHRRAEIIACARESGRSAG